MNFALMFNVLEGGVVEPINWSKDNLTPDRSVIILDEFNQIVWLWYGSQQGLVARRTALRQAESIRGHGYTIGKSIIGRDLREIREIDQRKIGRDPETDETYKALEALLNKKVKELENFVVTFETVETEIGTEVPIAKPEIKTETKPSIPKTTPTSAESTISKPIEAKKLEPPVVEPTKPKKLEPPVVKPSKPAVTPQASVTPTIKREISAEKPIISQPEAKKSTEDLEIQAKIGFVLVGILDHFEDIWVSKKEDNSFSVEYMDGPICSFSIKGSKISFTQDSFKGIAPTIKTEIQKKFVELSKLL